MRNTVTVYYWSILKAKPQFFLHYKIEVGVFGRYSILFFQLDKVSPAQLCYHLNSWQTVPTISYKLQWIKRGMNSMCDLGHMLFLKLLLKKK